MVQTIKYFYGHLLTALRFFYRSSREQDYRILNHGILKISRLQDIDSIILQASRCLNYMLNYHFFAFAMYNSEYNGGVDIWMDPGTDSIDLMNFIKDDFSPRNLDCNIRYFESPADTEKRSQEPVDVDRILALDVAGGQTRARLYLLPRRALLSYHDELLEILIKVTAAALQNFINLKKLENAAMVDPLTHCYNRRALDDYIDHDVASAERYAGDLSVIMFDLDHFKRINDSYGHRAGDAVLKAVAKSVMAAIRKSDYLARYGGEEFMLVLPGTRFSKAIELAERLRFIVENLKVSVDARTLNVTASFGVAAYKKGSGCHALFRRADEMLYEAKRLGRNRIKPDLRVYHNASKSISEEKPLLH